ncbi:MAG: aerobic C4-dicarboxylate transport protein [Gammaproteobacteria bacterium]|nr:aerobic C4-dicarboxylate transport protein [Gammaproteobacteria bacterium]
MHPLTSTPIKRPRWYAALYVQVLVGIAAGVIVGWLAPDAGQALKPLGDVFLKMIKMVIGLVIFCTVVAGLGSMSDMRKIGRVGGKALVYFEIVSTLALLFGAIVANVVRPGDGFNADPARLDAAAVAAYVGHAQESSVLAFLTGIVPTTIFEAFVKGDILAIVFVSVLFGYVLSQIGERGKPVSALIEATGHVMFGVIGIFMRVAPIGAFGAMAYTIGRFGMGSLRPLGGLILTFYATSAVFVCVVMGGISRWAGFNIFKLMGYLKDELFITLGAASSDVALPSLMEKLTHLGCSRSVVGLVVPTGYVFNADGTSIYMTLAALFVAQAMNIPLSFMQQLAIFGVSMIASKGASGISGAAFIALVGTLSVVPDIPLAGMALILGIDRIMSTGRAVVNLMGNAVATVVMASLESELDRTRMHCVLNGAPLENQAPGDARSGHMPRACSETNTGA